MNLDRLTSHSIFLLLFRSSNEIQRDSTRYESRGSVNNSACSRSGQASPINNGTVKCKSVRFEVAFPVSGSYPAQIFTRTVAGRLLIKTKSRGRSRVAKRKEESRTRTRKRITGWTFVKYKNDGCEARNAGKKGSAIFQAAEEAPRTFRQLLQSRTRTSKACESIGESKVRWPRVLWGYTYLRARCGSRRFRDIHGREELPV